MLYWWEKMVFRVSVLQMKTGCQGDISPFPFHIKMCFELQLTLFFYFWKHLWDVCFRLSIPETCLKKKWHWLLHTLSLVKLMNINDVWQFISVGELIDIFGREMSTKNFWTFLGTWGWVGGDGSRGATLNRWTEIGDSSCNVILLWPESYTSSPSRHHRGRWEIK